jgi:hypothetical protein
MTASTLRLSAIVLTAAFAASAHAEYRCNPAPSAIDARACAAAAQGPDALRRFIQQWTSQMSNLRFYDYVDSNTERAWEKTSKGSKEEPAKVELASNEGE